MSKENYFLTLNAIPCVTEKKNGLSYVSWADAWSEVKKVFPNSNFTIYENVDGFPFWESKFGIDVKVGVIINEIEHIVRLPVMDGANKAMKSEGYEYKTKYGPKFCEAANQFDINKAIQRAFAKAIAMHGIGLYVYRGEDLPEEIKEGQIDGIEATNSIISQVKNALTLEDLKKIFTYAKEISKSLGQENMNVISEIIKNRKDQILQDSNSTPENLGNKDDEIEKRNEDSLKENESLKKKTK